MYEVKEAGKHGIIFGEAVSPIKAPLLRVTLTPAVLYTTFPKSFLSLVLLNRQANGNS